MPQGVKLPVGMTPLVALTALIKASANEDFSERSLTIGTPSTVAETPEGANTSVLVSDTAGDYTGSVELFYTRRSLEDIWIDVVPTPVDLTDISTTHGLISQINVQTGLTLTIDDIVDEAIVVSNDSVAIVAKEGSCFFTPGSTAQVAVPVVQLPHISEFFTTNVLNGF